MSLKEIYVLPISKKEQVHFNFALDILSTIVKYDVALVGGANRELFERFYHEIEKEINDLDFSIFHFDGRGLTFNEMEELSKHFKEHCDVTVVDDGLKFLHLKLIGTKGTVNEGLELEFGTCRKEEYHDTRKPDTMVGTLKDDIERRDFTINSIYTRIIEGSSHYFYEDGKFCLRLEIHPLFKDIQQSHIDDIKNKILRTTSTNPDFVLNEDPLRIMRAIRFGKFYNGDSNG